MSRAKIETGEAIARLAVDYALAQSDERYAAPDLHFK